MLIPENFIVNIFRHVKYDFEVLYHKDPYYGLLDHDTVQSGTWAPAFLEAVSPSKMLIPT
jgi:hypothetical protein